MTLRHLAPDLLAAIRTHGRVAVATVIETKGSSPMPPGAAMFVTPAGGVSGSISGGCVEGAVYGLAQDVLADGASRRETFGFSDDEAFAVGLTCGGVIDVFVEAVDERTWPWLEELIECLGKGTPVAVAHLVPTGGQETATLALLGQETRGSLGNPGLDLTVEIGAEARLRTGTSGRLTLAEDGFCPGNDLEVFISVEATPPRLIVFGAVDFAGALVRAAKLLGFRVSVCDARAVFATAQRFPEADEVVVEWPHRWLATQVLDVRTAIAVLTHDPKFDVPAIIEALRSPAGYIGAMGSRTTHDDRVQRLRDRGVQEEDLARVHSPIGLDIGAVTPEETAISIMAELVCVARGGSGLPLQNTSGPLHRSQRRPSNGIELALPREAG